MSAAKAKTKDQDRKEQNMDFSADVSRLLGIVAHALYSNRDVFLRELVSNAADACDRLRYEAIKNPDLTKNDTELRIRVYKKAEERRVVVCDNGIGMNREELIENLGTIAKSGTAALMEQMKSATDKDAMNLIGQFGVGFYAGFMVVNRIEVISSPAGSDEAWHWESDGQSGFSIREASDEEQALLESDRGTTIILHINDESSEYLFDDKLKNVILTYSDHIDVPIYLGHPDLLTDEEVLQGKAIEDRDADFKLTPINRASALWTRPKNEIKDEEYSAFYKHIGHGMDEPMMTAHWTAEGVIEYTALLFIPTLRPFDLYDPTRRHATRLYVKRVFIADDLEGLVYPWLRFIRGIIDSKDLPLNISRETLQYNPVINKIRSSTARRILKDLEKLSQDDWPKFATFWGQFGAVLKEGLYDAVEMREPLFKVVHFHSTHKEEDHNLTTLAAYVERMKEGQEEIYYLSGENLETLKNSPQLEKFKELGLEVLFFTDTIDDFWLQNIKDFDGKPFKSITKGSIDLSRFENGETDKSDKKQEDKKKTEESTFKNLLALLSAELKDEIGNIRISSRLTSSPVCLIADDNEVDLRMERVLKIHQQYNPNAKRILEINPDHPLITKLAALADQEAEAGTVKDSAHLLLDQARIIQGEPVPDPAAFAKRMSLIMEKGL